MNPAIAGWASPGRQLNARAGIGTQGDPFESRTKVVETTMAMSKYR